MQYLKSFRLAGEDDELGFVLSNRSYQLDMACYSGNNAYPFHIFPHKGLKEIEFAPITIIYGGNGSGKSTVLNVIAEKLGLTRTAPFNYNPTMDAYLEYCSYRLCNGVHRLPDSSEIVTSDGVFDYLLDIRAINQGVDRERNEIFNEYNTKRKECIENGWQMRDLSDYDELKTRNEIRFGTKSKYTAKRMSGVELPEKSNGESAFLYFTKRIKEDALYLLDEPENSLSAHLQAELAEYLENSVRFYGCQLIISTHSPFILSMKGARIYDLDSRPVSVRHWTELENVREYYDLFNKKRREFESV